MKNNIHNNLLSYGPFNGDQGSPGKSQKEGQENQTTLKQLAGVPPALFLFRVAPGLPFGSALGSLELPQAALPWRSRRRRDRQGVCGAEFRH